MIRRARLAQIAALTAVLTATSAVAREPVRPGMTAAEVEAKLGRPDARARFNERLLIRWERPGGKRKAEPRTYVFDEQERLVGPLAPEGPAAPRKGR